ncbi:hypothetical protein DPEC_G00374330 [Dallia pectoralis]|nr:hypothetical protein DPEC_G00374330 [Dallia pectoralis]
MDYLSLEPDSSNTKDILVITDHFTKYAVAIPTNDQKATTVAKCLWEQFLVHYGFPERLLSDQGRDFESQLIQELCTVAGITKIRTSPYHPRGNPVERFNRTLLGMLGTLKDKQKSHWRDYVKPLTHAYNCTKNDVTQFTPYELMFGRQPRLPVDIAFGLPVKYGAPKTHSQYVKTLRARLEESYQIATKNSQKVAGRNKRRFDKAVRESTLEEGDQVLVRNLRLRNKHKLADKWESTVYKVLKRMRDLPVYTVQPINGDGPVRTLHRDHLLPCGNLIEEEEPEQAEPRIRRPKTRRSQPQILEKNSESEDDTYFCPTQLSVLPEERVIQIYEVPRGQRALVTPTAEDNDSLAMSLTPEPQDELQAGSPPVWSAEPVEMSLEPENMAQQPPTEEDATLPDMANGNRATEENVPLPDMTIGNPPTAEDDGDVCPRNHENTGNRETVDDTQQLNNKPTVCRLTRYNVVHLFNHSVLSNWRQL